MVLIGSLYASDSVHTDYGAAKWVVVVIIYLFSATYCMTWALGIKIFASEIQPLATSSNKFSPKRKLCKKNLLLYHPSCTNPALKS
jgi:hypothetical protein